MFLDSVCILMASRIESGETSFVGLTVLSSSCIFISGKRTASNIGVGSSPVLWSAHWTTALNISISGAQNESRHIKSLTEDYKKKEKIIHVLKEGLKLWTNTCTIRKFNLQCTK